jgi:hypothetical protein
MCYNAFCHCKVVSLIRDAYRGEVVEWFKAAVLKTAEVARSPWVRIPPSP